MDSATTPLAPPEILIVVGFLVVVLAVVQDAIVKRNFPNLYNKAWYRLNLLGGFAFGALLVIIGSVRLAIQ